MNSVFRIPIPLAILVLVIGSCVSWAAQTSRKQTGKKLTLDGKTLSTDIQIINGRAYLPLRDVAKALNRSVVQKNGVFGLIQPTAGNSHNGPSGQLGIYLVSGPWQLRVASVQQVKTYLPRYGASKEPIIPREDGDVLILITCQLKNGTRKMQEVSFDKSSSGNTALLDAQERGYVPLAYDTRNSNYQSAKMPPGTTLDFVVLFSVPEGAALTALTYTVKGIEMDQSRDFQVSFKP